MFAKDINLFCSQKIIMLHIIYKNTYGGKIMNTLLIFFAFPIAVIIISIILQKLLKNPIAVAALIFAIFLIVTFAAFDETFLIATLVYTLLALITALIVRFICESNNNNNNMCEILNDILRNNNVGGLLNNVSNNCNNNNESELNTVADILNTNNGNNSNNNSCRCSCSRYRRYR